MNAEVLKDMHDITINRIFRDHDRLAALEAADFEEQFNFADDDQTRSRLCKRWLRIHAPNGRQQWTR